MPGEAEEGAGTIRIAGEGVAAELAPAAGGRLARLTFGARDALAPLGPWSVGGRRWPKGGAYPLIPFSNRIRNARLAFEGRAHRLEAHPDAAPHALHGPAHLDRWRLAEADGGAATLELERLADAHWPWAIAARQRFSCAGAGFVVTLTLENRDVTAMPAGLGWHPYFAFPPGSRIAHDSARAWEADDEFLPTRRQQAIAGGEAPAEGTFYLSRWTAVDLDLAGLRLRMTADPLFDHLVLHRPPGGLYYCAEPVSHLADAFNLADEGVAGVGARRLGPGESLSGAVRLAPF